MYFFVSAVSVMLTSNFVLQNVGRIGLYLIQTYSRVQLFLRTQTQKRLTSDGDYLDCLIGSRLLHANTDDAFDKINVSDVSVLISNKNMVMFYPPIDEYFADYEVSSVRFISAIVTIDAVQYEIKLKTPDYSFYVVGNDLNVDFVRYYLRKFKNISLPCDVEYLLDIVDDNVKFFTLDQHECISIEKDTYQIYTYRDEKKEERKEERKDEKNWDKEETYDVECDDDECDDVVEEEEEEEDDGLPTLADIFSALKIELKHDNNQYHYTQFIDKEDDEEDEEDEDEEKEDEEDNSYVYPKMIGPS